MRLVAIGVVVLVSVSAASGAARPISPAPGAVTSSHPPLVWQLGPNETSDAVYVARRPDTTPQGQFFSENVVATGIVSSTQTTWAPERALFAGPHWWNVWTTNRDTFDSSYSAPSPFTVGATIRLLRVRVSRESWNYSPDRLNIDVRWVTNVPEVVVEAVITRGSRRVGRVRASQETLISLDPDSETVSWTRPRRVRTGMRLGVQVRVIGGGRSVRAARRFVRAP